MADSPQSWDEALQLARPIGEAPEAPRATAPMQQAAVSSSPVNWDEALKLAQPAAQSSPAANPMQPGTSISGKPLPSLQDLQTEIGKEIQNPETAPMSRRGLVRASARTGAPVDWDIHDLENDLLMTGLTGAVPKLMLAAQSSPAAMAALKAGTAGLGAYFTVQMGKGAGESAKQGLEALKQGDYLGAFRHAGAAGINAAFAAAGLREASKLIQLEPSASYQEKQASMPPSQRDVGAGGKRGPVTPEVVPPEPKPAGGLGAAQEPIKTTAETPAAPKSWDESLQQAQPINETPGFAPSPAVDKMESVIQAAEQQAIRERAVPPETTAVAAPEPLPSAETPESVPPITTAPVPPPAEPAGPVPAESPAPKSWDEALQMAQPEPAAETTPQAPAFEKTLQAPAADTQLPEVEGGSPGEPVPSESVPAVPQERGPGWVGNIPTSEIQVDAPRFQFKRNVGQGGAGEELREVTKYDPEKAGMTSVWKDPADGKTYVVNGHHRVELAQRTGYPEMTVRYLDAETAQQARAKGALINISEGRGESTDAAKVFRDMNATPESLAVEGVSLKGKIASEGLAISKLAPPIFDDVMSGELSPARGAVIGSGVAEHADQEALYDLVKQREKNGKRLTNDQVGELIRLTNEAPKQTETQESLFGSEEMTRSLLPEKAEVSDYIRKQLSSEKKLFGAVSSDAAAAKLNEAGNVIKAGENAQQFQRANQGIALYDKLSTRSGPIATALDRAAQAIADGENANDVKQRTYKEIRGALRAQADQLAGVSEISVRGAEGLGSEGSLQAGPGELDSGPQLSQRVGETPEPAEPQAQAVGRRGAQLVDTLRVNDSAADLLREAYSFAGGVRQGSFDGAAVQSRDVRVLLKGLDGLAEQGHPDAGRIAAELRKASASGLRGVAVAGPEAEAHEQIHFAVDRLQFDPEIVKQHGPTLVAIMEARSRRFASGSDKRVIREVATRIIAGEHDTLKLDGTTGRSVLENILANCTHDLPESGTLEALAHEQFKDTIGRAKIPRSDAGTAEGSGEEPGPSGSYRQEAGRGRGDAGIRPDRPGEGSEEEGPELAARRVKRSEEDDEPGLFNSDSERQAQVDAEHNDAQLLHDRLTAQLKSGGAVKPTKLKPAETRSMFDEEQPESGDLFGSERGSISLKRKAESAKTRQARATGKLAEQNKQYGEDTRSWYTARRDTWTARVNQELARLRKVLPDPIDQEALAIYRDFKNRPGELAQWLAGTHAGYAEVRNIDISRENIEKLRAPIERAMNPTPAMKEADQALTKIAAVSLAEGQRLGFIDKHVKPEEYVTHLLFPEGEEGQPSFTEKMGKALGNKIGRNFPYNQQRNFPTLLEAAA